MRAALETLKQAADLIPNPIAASAVKAAAELVGYILDQEGAWEAAEERRQKLAARAEELGTWGAGHPPT